MCCKAAPCLWSLQLWPLFTWWVLGVCSCSRAKYKLQEVFDVLQLEFPAGSPAIDIGAFVSSFVRNSHRFLKLTPKAKGCEITLRVFSADTKQ